MALSRCRRVAAAMLAGVAGLVAAPMSAPAEPAVGLLEEDNGHLVVFDTTHPTIGMSFLTITGVPADEQVRGIDVRPADGRLYAVSVSRVALTGSAVTTYTLDPATGVATRVGVTVAPLTGAGNVPGGWDFNPVADRARYVNGNDENARINPDTGLLTSDDTDLTPAATTDIIGLAYDRNVPGATATTAYAINRATSQLATLGGVDGGPPTGSANAGVITDFGALGVTLYPFADAGFDISPSGVAYAAMTQFGIGPLTHLYTIDLATGHATQIDRIGLGTSQLQGLAILPPAAPVPPPPPPPPPPPAAAPPPPPAAPADRAAPKVLVMVSPASARLTPASVKAIRIDFSCSEGCRAAGSLRVGATTIASRSMTLLGADVARLRLGTTITQRIAIGRLKRAARTRRGVLTLTFTDAAGNRRTLTRSITLRR